MLMIDSVEARQIHSEEDGNLVLGFTWFTYQPGKEDPPKDYFDFALFAVLGLILSLFMISAPTYQPFGYAVLALAAGSLLIFIVKEQRSRTERHAAGMSFSTTGEIFSAGAQKSTDPGNEVHLNGFTLKRTIDDIQSISMQPMKNNAGQHYKHERDKNDPTQGYFAYSVVVDFTTGERYYAGQYFNEDDARIVVVQLQQALQKVLDRRQELAAANA